MPRLVPLLVAILFTTTVRAEPPSPEQIQHWINDLDDSNYKKREQAAKGLHLAGPDATAALGKAAKTGTAETTNRAMRILGEMVSGSDAKAEAAARRQLRRLADGESKVAAAARSLLTGK